MVDTINLGLCIHSHQPVGNFDHVFAEATDRCYKPFLEVLSRHGGIRLTLHYSGCLFEWLESNRPEIIDLIGKLVSDKRVELVGSGFYEPILSSLREEDALGQLLMMSDYLEKRFGVRPSGMWLTERVWDTSIPRLAAAAGIKYTLADDTHFRLAGLDERKLHGFYVTETAGHPLYVFPIDKTLRYSIPFAEPERTLDHLEYLRTSCNAVAACYGDDGEKFGVWPDTYEWVYEKGWLDRFFETLENAGNIDVKPLGEIVLSQKPEGRVYLPLASYDEMMEWSIPSPEMGLKYREFLDILKSRGELEKYRAFVSGGNWRNFFAKYHESDAMNKKATLVSRRLDKATAEESVPSAGHFHLWRAQCNCGYWHGLFGGLYLNYLRHAIYANTIEAQKYVDRRLHGDSAFIDVESSDVDMDGSEEILIETPVISAAVVPALGGSIREISYKPAAFCLTNVLGRRIEAYHLAAGHDGEEGGDGPKTIHSQRDPKVSNWRDYLVQDKYRKYCFVDHILPLDTDIRAFSRSESEEGIDPALPYSVHVSGGESEAEVVMSASTEVKTGDGLFPVTLEKKLVFSSTKENFSFSIGITNNSNVNLEFLYISEWNLTPLAGHADDRKCFTQSNGTAESYPDEENIEKDVISFGISNNWDKFRAGVRLEKPCTLWKFPIETISQSESGMEKTYQGTCFGCVYKVALSPGARFEIHGEFFIEQTR